MSEVRCETDKGICLYKKTVKILDYLRKHKNTFLVSKFYWYMYILYTILDL